LRYADWRAVVARVAARQLQQRESSLFPQLIGHIALGAAVAAYEQWLVDDNAELEVVMATAFNALQFHSAFDAGGDP
jgi:hypothetical protein